MRHRYQCGHEVEFALGNQPFPACPVCVHNASPQNPPPGFVYATSATAVANVPGAFGGGAVGAAYRPPQISASAAYSPPPSAPLDWLDQEISRVRSLAFA